MAANDWSLAHGGRRTAAARRVYSLAYIDEYWHRRWQAFPTHAAADAAAVTSPLCHDNRHSEPDKDGELGALSDDDVSELQNA